MSGAAGILGGVLVAAGDLKEARRRFEQSLELDQRLAQANPASAEAQRDVSADLSKLGNVLVTAGDLKEARRRFEQSLEMRQRLAEANPASAQAQRDLIVSYVELAIATGQKDFWQKALVIAERLSQEGRLPPRDAPMLEAIRKQAGSAQQQ